MSIVPSHTELKRAAQDELMGGMKVALSWVDEMDNPALKAEMIVQFRRVEKFFGYTPDSWSIGL